MLVLATPFVGAWSYCGHWEGDDNNVVEICLRSGSSGCGGWGSDHFESSLAQWNDVVSSPTYRITTADTTFGPQNGESEAVWTTYAAAASLYGPSSSTTLASTYHWDTGGCAPFDETDFLFFVDQDFTTDPDGTAWDGPYPFDEVATHEAGHGMALLHEEADMTLMNPIVHTAPPLRGYPHADERAAMIANPGFDTKSYRDLTLLPYDGAGTLETHATQVIEQDAVLRPDDTFTIENFRVANWGLSGDEPSVDVDFFVWGPDPYDDTGGGEPIFTNVGTRTWAPLRYYGHLVNEPTFVVPTVRSGWYEVIAYVDLNEEVTEHDEDNNELVFHGFWVDADADSDGWDDIDDCAPFDSSIYPGATEQCNGVDDDCDGSLPDAENDFDDDEYVECDGDCNPFFAHVHPGATEQCDGLDGDCDGAIPNDELDPDGDGFITCDCVFPFGNCGDCGPDDPLRHPFATEMCNGLDDDCDGTLLGAERDGDADGYPSCAGDCDDAEPARNPGATETCDGLDNDCDRHVPAAELDPDGDGLSACAGDCAPADPAGHPGAVESCNGDDDDCDGVIPDDELDPDEDGFMTCEGDCGPEDPLRNPLAIEICDGLDDDCDGTLLGTEHDGDGDGYPSCAGDCDDANVARNPGVTETCNGFDDNCDRLVPPDEFDADGDGLSACAGDCAPADVTRHPGAAEVCNGLDDVCDGVVPPTELDVDGDGVSACAGDCDAADPMRYPGASETCNGLDDDCDGQIPDDEVDADGDGLSACAGDCAPDDPARYPGATDPCDGLDDDCDGQVDEDCVRDDTDGDAHTDEAERDSDRTPIDPEGAVDTDGGNGATAQGCGCDQHASPGRATLAMALLVFAGVRRRSRRPAGALVGVLASILLLGPGTAHAARIAFDEPDRVTVSDSGGSCVPFAADATSDDPCIVWTPAIDCGGDASNEGRLVEWTAFPQVDDDLTTDSGGASAIDRPVRAQVDAYPDAAVQTVGGLSAVKLLKGVWGLLRFPATTFTLLYSPDEEGSSEFEFEDAFNALDTGGVGFAMDLADTGGPDTDGPDTDGPDTGVPFCWPSSIWDQDEDCFEVPEDCNDWLPSIHPGAPEVCDGIDDDCDGVIPDDELDPDDDGFSACGGDCAPEDPSRGPLSIEICNGLDDNCDGTLLGTERDGDGDGYPSCAGDCDDADAARNPEAPETCDGLDDDCDGHLPPAELDPDGDGISACAGDCAPADPARYPGAVEVCDGNDNDCDGAIPDDDLDSDEDGFTICGGDCAPDDPQRNPLAIEICDGLDDDCDGTLLGTEHDGDGDHYPSCAGDCDDADAARNPGVTETCNGLDDNCDRLVPPDELDPDGDGVSACAGDCAPDDASRHPGAAEACNDVDDDCDGLILDDEADADGDGLAACAGDCAPDDPAQHPGAAEVCNGFDDDCDGQIDDDCVGDDTDADGDTDDAGSETDRTPLDPGTDDTEGGPTETAQGCGCDQDASPGHATFAMALLVLAGLRRRSRRRAGAVVGLLVSVLLLHVGTAQAAQVPLDEKDLVAVSDLIVEATVRRVDMRPWGPLGVPVTVVTLEVYDVWKGDAARTVEVVQPGGRLPDGRYMEYEEAVDWRPGLPVLVFLERVAGSWVPVGGQVGVAWTGRGVIEPVPYAPGVVVGGRESSPSGPAAPTRPFARWGVDQAHAIVEALSGLPRPARFPRLSMDEVREAASRIKGKEAIGEVSPRESP